MTDRSQIDLSVTAEMRLYYDLHVPEGAAVAPLLIAVHGYGAHKRYMMREAKLVAPEHFVIASLQAPHPHYRRTDDGYKIGFGWLSDHHPEEHVATHHKFVLDVVDRLVSEGAVDPQQIYMYGFSQACALNFRFALTHPSVLRGIVGVCGGIPGDLDTNEKYRPFSAQTLYLYGDDDEFYTQDQFATFNSRLAAMLPNYHSRHYAAKHEITEEMRRDIRAFFSETRSIES
mgnify:CR=1 FL=1